MLQQLPKNGFATGRNRSQSASSPKKLVLLFILLSTFVSFTIAAPKRGVTATIAPTMDKTTTNVLSDESRKATHVVFSDVDGTLVHYPKKIPKGDKGNSLLKLPPSSTGMRGVISSKTISLVRDIRQKGTKVVLVSGMRTSTMMARLPFLPRADAYCTEGGGRIFYAVDKKDDSGYVVTPQRYDGCSEEDLVPFSLVEDMTWKSKIEKIAGKYSPSLEEMATNPDNVPSINERDGLLWDFARHLTSKGYVVDTAGYSTCFRVNEKNQTSAISKKEFAALSNGQLEVWEGLGTSVNLGCVDFYPLGSGKKNCCQYLAEKYCPDVDDDTVLLDHAVCLCDDDNDIEMAKACRHAYIPAVTSDNMATSISKNPSHFSVTDRSKTHGPSASEAALIMILAKLVEEEEAKLK